MNPDSNLALNVKPALVFTPRSFYDIVTKSKRKPNFLLLASGGIAICSAIACGGGVGASIALAGLCAIGNYAHQWYWWWYWVTWLTITEAN